MKKEDVDVIMAELEVTEDEATSALTAAQDNENNGDASIKGQQLIAAALRRLVTQSIWYLNTMQTNSVCWYYNNMNYDISRKNI